VPTFAAAIVAARRDGHDGKSGEADQGDKESGKSEIKVAREQEKKVEQECLENSVKTRDRDKIRNRLEFKIYMEWGNEESALGDATE
jgi:hypothetical protein